jgi:hypothetical protein
LQSIPTAGPKPIVQRDDGLFRIGLDDETADGPFPSRKFARDVWLHPADAPFQPVACAMSRSHRAFDYDYKGANAA